MLNPWLTLPFQAVRLGWQTQTIVVDQLMRIAGISTSDRKMTGGLDTKEIPLAEDRVAAAANPSSPVATAPATKSKHRQVAQKVMKIHKKRGPGSKRSRSQ
jgi:hypothetical protein